MQPAPFNRRRSRRLRYVLLACALALVLVGGAAAIHLWTESSMRARVEAEVRAAVPIGTPRADAEAWAQKRFRFIPTYHEAPIGDRFVGRSIPDLAGVPADELVGAVRTTAQPMGLVGDALNKIRPEHVWIYFLIDRENRVCGYCFLSLSQLRVMEAEHRRGR